jgi:ubiquinone/menaquinone biosynthesis C-methylase UbiE
MNSKPLEGAIIEKFDSEAGVNSVRDSITDANFELAEILSHCGAEGNGRKLLDVGSGKGIFVAALRAHGYDAEGIEPSEALLEIAKKNFPDYTFRGGSATALPYPAASFDCVICIEVLEHIPETETAIRELTRVLKPGGRLVIIDKNIFSLHPAYFVPTALWKYAAERRDKWLYPHDFPFKERYFSPAKLRRLIAKYCALSEVRYLRYESGNHQRSAMRKILSSGRQALGKVLHAFFPFLDFYASWRAVK